VQTGATAVAIASLCIIINLLRSNSLARPVLSFELGEGTELHSVWFTPLINGVTVSPTCLNTRH
jgi:hypothetical protein